MERLVAIAFEARTSLSRGFRWLGCMAAIHLVCVGTPTAAESGNPHGFTFPENSRLLSAEAIEGRARFSALVKDSSAACNMTALLKGTPTGAEIRACERKVWPQIIREVRKIFPADIRSDTIAGVPVDVITPTAGVRAVNARKILINLHGGGFLIGGHFHGLMESIPLAAVGGYEIVSVDYRQGPEYRFPAATVDAVNVYRSLLKHYDAKSIGIYGCSAGALLTGQVVAALQKEGVPLPGAIAINCGAPTSRTGDSQSLSNYINGPAPEAFNHYMHEASATDPLAYPADFDAVLSKFPPTLLMTSSRDSQLSPVAALHTALVQLGVKADLYVFEGYGHAEFLYNPYVPENRQSAKFMSEFFDKHLRRN